jgi:ribosomal protein S18 acetylase RimI-like enzyme
MKHIHTFESFLNEASVNGYDLQLKSLEDNEYIVKATKGGKEVGELRFIKSKFKPVLKATIVSVDPNYRRQGIATSMYVYAEKELKTKFVQNDEVLTPDGKALWNSTNKKFGI